jgi:hypothetical protein
VHRLALCEVFLSLRPMPVKRRGVFAVRVPRNELAVGCLAVPKYSPLAGLKVGADVVEGGHLGNVSYQLAARQESNPPRANL